MARSLVGNASSPKQVKAAGETTKRERARWDNQLLTVSETVEGRAVLHHFLDRCGVWEISFSDNPYRTAFNEGNRNPGLWLLAELGRVNPDAVQQMTKEAIQALNQRAEQKERTEEPLEDEEDGN